MSRHHRINPISRCSTAYTNYNPYHLMNCSRRLLVASIVISNQPTEYRNTLYNENIEKTIFQRSGKSEERGRETKFLLEVLDMHPMNDTLYYHHIYLDLCSSGITQSG